MTQEQRETLVEVCSRLYSYRHLMELSEKEQDFLDITIQLLDGVLDFDGINELEIAPSITTQAHTDWDINASNTYTTGHNEKDTEVTE